jgi:hypothetical protein
MTTLFAAAVAQITRRSWLPDDTPARRPGRPEAAAKRREVIQCLQRAGKPVTRTWVEDYTGYTKQSVNHILVTLVALGQVRRIEGGEFILWEIIKP